MSAPIPTIDSAIDAAAKALAHSYDKDYCHLPGEDQAWWRNEAQIAVNAWLEDRRRCAEENVPAPSSLLAELAEARAEIARLTEERDEWRDSASAVRESYVETLGELVARKSIVEAATALVEHRRDRFRGSLTARAWECRNDELIGALVAAVEEGNKP